MTIAATTQWEVRTTGAATNGGGYSSGGTDYSQQDAAQIAVTDAVGNNTTTITSATANFPADCVGNIVYLTGGGYGSTTARRHVATRVSATEITVDDTVPTGTGMTLNLGGAADSPATLTGALVAGNTVHVKAGTYTLGAAATFPVGTAALPIAFVGYNATRNDNPTTGSRPTIACGAYNLTFGNYNRWSYFAKTGTSGLTYIGLSGSLRHCNLSASATYSLWSANYYAHVESCEFSGYGGWAMAGYGGNRVLGCHFHDHTAGQNGINCSGSAGSCFVFGSVFDTITLGISSPGPGWAVLGNVFYNCTNGFAAASYGNTVIGNIFHTCTGAAVQNNTAVADWLVGWNTHYNNGANYSNVSGAVNDTLADPKFLDPANNDFRLKPDSPAYRSVFTANLPNLSYAAPWSAGAIPPFVPRVPILGV
jgi:hypothetical protein